MNMNVNRRQAMGQIIGLVSVAAGGGIMATAMAADTCPGDISIGIGSEGTSDLAANLLTYVKVEPLAVAKRAYEDYGKGGCMYGVFDAIVKELAAQGHEDACKFAAIPTNITVLWCRWYCWLGHLVRLSKRSSDGCQHAGGRRS
ncbi:MAG: hypothetical protein LRY40_09740 [Shewanella fodinae]|nr:hypothetical protein [Shewanella fodinae]